jgi:oligosaccharide repeat unit polymerase
MYAKQIESISAYGFGTEKLSRSIGEGAAAHADVILMFPVTFFLIISDLKRKSTINWLIILLWLFFAFSYNSKTWILIPLIAGIIGRMALLKKKVNLKRIIILFGLGLLIFYVSYSLSFNYFASWKFIRNHFIVYTNSGLLSFSEHLRLNKKIGISLEFLFEPIYNIYYKLTGKEMISIISNLNERIGSQQYSNVKTFFGEIYIYGGIIGGIFTSFVWGWVTYLFLALSVMIKDVFFFLIYFIIISALFFGWFGIYFNNLTYYEIIIVGIFLLIVTRLLISKGKIRTIKL